MLNGKYYFWLVPASCILVLICYINISIYCKNCYVLLWKVTMVIDTCYPEADRWFAITLLLSKFLFCFASTMRLNHWVSFRSAALELAQTGWLKDTWTVAVQLRGKFPCALSFMASIEGWMLYCSLFHSGPAPMVLTVHFPLNHCWASVWRGGSLSVCWGSVVLWLISEGRPPTYL